ncbi:aminoglycoside phosphotransferase family protein [Actinoalloteichus caeruleus]|uniref:aminoglycoside phosphotransferase family protein n=1 Tax=Actinoalloteichus cyanogriseus TaxID=2893586 RepID=UPI003BB98C8B
MIVPGEFAEWRSRVDGEEGRSWVAALPELVRQLCVDWGLTLDDTPPEHGGSGLVVMAHRRHQACALKVSWPTGTTADEARALRTWDGAGAVRLLGARPDIGGLLMERLNQRRSLRGLGLWEAAEVAGTLLRRLAVPAPPGLRSLGEIADDMVERLPSRQRTLGDPIPPAWLDTARGLAADLWAEDHGTLIHADLHYGNVLAGEREPWLAVDPRPVRGRPEFSVPELLWTRADDDAIGSDADLRRLLAMLVETGELEPRAAHGWAVARCVDYWLWGLENGLTTDPVRCHRVLGALLG